jgi:hypothetical protein
MGVEVVEKSWHDEVCDSTTGVTEATGERVCSSDNVLVKETCRPDLARYERATEDTDEESQNDESLSVVNGECQSSGECTSKQAASEDISWAETIAKWSSNNTYNECCSKSNNVGVGNFILCKVQIRLDGLGNEW